MHTFVQNSVSVLLQNVVSVPQKAKAKHKVGRNDC